MGKSSDDLALIKKYYGEDMMHFCRFHFATILEEPMALYNILSSTFAPNKYLLEDIAWEEKKDIFKDYVLSFLTEVESKKTELSVEELLESVGYDIFECHNHEEVLRFKKYYCADERLCTFNDPHRTDKYNIFFLKKKNIDQIKRDDFLNPRREDQYGVSLLCLQFYRGEYQSVSIKSRYNETVVNPDATYSNNLEKIVPGLTDAFRRDYGFNIKNPPNMDFELRNYININFKYYKYTYEINNIYYCLDNIIIDNGKVIDTYTDKSRYIFLDYFILDRQKKILFAYDEEKDAEDSFLDFFRKANGEKEGIILKTDVINEEGGKKVIITCWQGDIEIHLDEYGKIISYNNPFLIKCKDDFMGYNESLRSLSLENLVIVGNNFLSSNHCLKHLNLPKLECCGNRFLSNNKSLQTIEFPYLKQCGEKFLRKNNKISFIYLPKLESCKFMFMEDNTQVEEINLPNLVSVGDAFLCCNNNIKSVNLPNLRYCENRFLECAQLEKLSFPNLMQCSSNFLRENYILQKIEAPMLTQCGDSFLSGSVFLEILELPLLEKVGSNFLYYNEYLESFKAPRLCDVGSFILAHNTSLKELELAPDILEYDEDVQRLKNVVENNKEKPKIYCLGGENNE